MHDFVVTGPGIAEVMQLLPNATTPIELAPAPSYTKYFSWKSGNGVLHQTWYDDAETLAVKYAHTKSHRVKGLGIWTSDATMFNKVVANQMWAAVPQGCTVRCWV